ncbi:pyridoxamine 5'-phosphate oxidase family protein [Salarchaeum sp. III]|uniref:pyridoxamine 5'-phosphate oxidase family protein n=1 Tax=Salarchaeum sp. III TaxID=3107927 RepID=UPI002ED77E99
MELVENTLDGDLAAFLERPLFCFLATIADGAPCVSPLWFLWEDDAIWSIADDQKTYPDRIREQPATALAIVDFDQTRGTVQHVGMRGRTTVTPHDPDRAIRLLTNYLGQDMSECDTTRFPDPNTWGDEMVMLRCAPETIVARDQSYVPTPAMNDT